MKTKAIKGSAPMVLDGDFDGVDKAKSDYTNVDDRKHSKSARNRKKKDLLDLPDGLEVPTHWQKELKKQFKEDSHNNLNVKTISYEKYEDSP